MIMSLKAASLGLNMVAACHVLMLDLWWNPTTEDQAIDRAHRIGQTRPVTVLRLTVRDTVEDRILALQVFSFGCPVNMRFCKRGNFAMLVWLVYELKNNLFEGEFNKKKFLELLWNATELSMDNCTHITILY